MLKAGHLKFQIASLGLVAVLLAACAPAVATVIVSTPTTGPKQPVTSATPEPTDIPVPTPEATEPADSVVQGVAPVESLEIRILESFPVQIHVVARGNLTDGCTEIDQITQARSENTFEITITTLRPANALCPEVLIPFEEVIPLDVAGLPAGTYTVNANGLTQTFTLDVDNFLPPPAPAAAELPESCKTSQTTRLLYVNLADGYCLNYPAGFRLGSAAPGLMNLFGLPVSEGPEAVRALMNIAQQGSSNGRSLSEVVDEVVSPFQDLPITRTAGTLGGEQAEIVEGLPGITGSRWIYAIHNDMVYSLSFFPFDPSFPEAQADATELWEVVTDSFAFLTPEFKQVYAACPAASEATSPYLNLTDGYCLTYPSGFEVSAGETASGITNFVGPAMSEGPEPVTVNLTVTMEGPANGRSLAQEVDEVVSQFPDLTITRSAGTLGGEEAEILEGLPGVAGTRQMVVVHEGTVYSLILSPVDPAFPQAAADAEAIWTTVTSSFTFVDE